MNKGRWRGGLWGVIFGEDNLEFGGGERQKEGQLGSEKWMI